MKPTRSFASRMILFLRRTSRSYLLAQSWMLNWNFRLNWTSKLSMPKWRPKELSMIRHLWYQRPWCLTTRKLTCSRIILGKLTTSQQSVASLMCQSICWKSTAVTKDHQSKVRAPKLSSLLLCRKTPCPFLHQIKVYAFLQQKQPQKSNRKSMTKRWKHNPMALLWATEFREGSLQTRRYPKTPFSQYWSARAPCWSRTKDL